MYKTQWSSISLCTTHFIHTHTYIYIYIYITSNVIKIRKAIRNNKNETPPPPNIYTNLNSPNGNFWIKKKRIYVGRKKGRMVALYMLASSPTTTHFVFSFDDRDARNKKPTTTTHMSTIFIVADNGQNFHLCFRFVLPTYDCISTLFWSNSLLVVVFCQFIVDCAYKKVQRNSEALNTRL